MLDGIQCFFFSLCDSCVSRKLACCARPTGSQVASSSRLGYDSFFAVFVSPELRDQAATELAAGTVRYSGGCPRSVTRPGRIGVTFVGFPRLSSTSGAYFANVTASFDQLFFGFTVDATADGVIALVGMDGLQALEQHRRLSMGWPEPEAEYAPGTAPSPVPTPVANERRQLADAAPWHLDRIDQPSLPLDSKYNSAGNFDGTGIVIYVLDSGVAGNSDFGGRMLFGGDFVSDGRGGDTTCMGHGTHVRDCLAPCVCIWLMGGYCFFAAVVVLVVAACSRGVSLLYTPSPLVPCHRCAARTVCRAGGKPNIRLCEERHRRQCARGGLCKFRILGGPH